MSARLLRQETDKTAGGDGAARTVKVLSNRSDVPPPKFEVLMETYYTNLRGWIFFFEVTGNSFEGRYSHKISGVGEQAIRSMAVGKESWVWDKPRELSKNKRN